MADVLVGKQEAGRLGMVSAYMPLGGLGTATGAPPLLCAAISAGGRPDWPTALGCTAKTLYVRGHRTHTKHSGRGKNIPDCGYEDRQILRALACRDVKGGCVPFHRPLQLHGGAVFSQLSEI